MNKSGYITFLVSTHQMYRSVHYFFFFSSRRRHTRFDCDWSSDVCSSDLDLPERENADAAMRLVEEGGADLVKLFASPELVRAVAQRGIPVFAEFHGDQGTPENLVKQAKHLEQAGASLLDFRHSGPEAGAAVAKAVSIPVLGGLGGGPWLDGRIRMVHAAIGYAASNLNSEIENYANVAQVTLKAITAYAEDVRAGRHLKGQRPA